jgi:hypothetical protein
MWHHLLENVNGFVAELPSPPAQEVPHTTFKQLAHTVAHATSSGKAGLGGLLVREELVALRPTRLIAMLATGCSSTNLSAAAKATPTERMALVKGQLTLAELKARSKGNGNGFAIFDTEMLEHKPHISAEEMLTAYYELAPAEQVWFSREIGIARCWVPSERACRST